MAHRGFDVEVLDAAEDHEKVAVQRTDDGFIVTCLMTSHGWIVDLAESHWLYMAGLEGKDGMAKITLRGHEGSW